MDGLRNLGESTNKRLFFIGLLVPIFFLLIVFAWNFWTYVGGLLGAITLFAILRPQMKWLVHKKKIRRPLSAVLLVLEAIVFFLIPLGTIISMLVEVFSNNQLDVNKLYSDAVAFVDMVAQYFGFKITETKGVIGEQVLASIAKMGQDMTTKLIVGVYSFVVNAVILLFLLFFMLLSQEYIEQALRELLPFSRKNKRILIAETKKIIVANAIGIPLLALVQGMFSYMGYSFFGIEKPLFCAVLTAFATIIPMVGSMIFWLPLGLSILLEGSIGAGIGFFVYAFIFLFGTDNLGRFLLQKTIANIHPLITVFGVIFGLSVFGFWGVIFGPLILALLILLIRMFRVDYIPNSKAIPRVTTREKILKK